MSDRLDPIRHPWNYCPQCGAEGTNDPEGGGNAKCFHCGKCFFIECLDSPHERYQAEIDALRQRAETAEQERDDAIAMRDAVNRAKAPVSAEELGLAEMRAAVAEAERDAALQRCPIGYDHSATWRCYAVWLCDLVMDAIPESWPMWMHRPFMWVIMRVEERGSR